MNKQCFLVSAGALLFMTGCFGSGGDAEGPETTPPPQTLTGEVFYRERKYLPPGAELHITLKDVPKAGEPAALIAASETLLAGSQPYQFTLDYSPADIHENLNYTLRAEISFYGELLFTSTKRLDPFQHPEGRISIEVRSIDSADE